MVRTLPPLKAKAKAKGSSGVVKKTKVTKHVVTVNKKKKYKFKKQEEEEFVEPVPDGWPVASIRPQKEYNLAMELSKNDNEKEEDDDDEESKQFAGLRPGKALQSCSGTDVQLSRGASARPNLSKGKGRFLIILPGNMSLTPQTAVAASAPFTPASKTNDSESKNDSPQPTPIQTPSSDPLLSDTATATATPSNHNVFGIAANLPRLGKIEKLGSDNPILRVPFPDDDGRELIFRGRKISTSSRFMSLTCKGGKGAVNCKDVFSSVIVFGEAGWEDNGFTRETEDISSDDISIRHYGGSTRTVDGGKGGSKKQKAWSTTPKATRTMITQDTTSPMEESEDEEELDLPDDEDDDDDEAFFDNTKPSGLSQRSASKRTTARSSARSKVNYADTLETEEAEEERSDEDNSVKDQDGPKTNQKNKKTPKVITSTSTSTHSKNKAGRSKNTIDTLVLSSDEEDEAVDISENTDSGEDEILSKTPVSAKRAPHTVSQAKKKYVDTLNSNSDEEDNDEDDLISKESAVDGEDASSEEETTKRSKKLVSTKKTVTKQSKSSLARSKSSIAKVKNKAVKSKKTVDALVLSSDEEDEAVDVAENTDSGEDEILSKTLASAKRTPRRSASQAKTSYVDTVDSNSDEEDNDEDDLISKESAVDGEDASSKEEATKISTKKASTKKTVTKQSKPSLARSKASAAKSQRNTSSEPTSDNRKRARSTEKMKNDKKVEQVKTGRGTSNSTSKESKTMEKEDKAQSLIPSSPVMSPRRRRHKSPSKKSSSSPSKSADGNSRKRRLVCDLTNDDEFNFTN